MKIEDSFLRVGDKHDGDALFSPFEEPGPYFPGPVTEIAKVIFKKIADVFLQIV